MDDRITLDFFANQLVCHLNPEAIDPNPQIYPRHFGMTFLHQSDFNQILERVQATGLDMFHGPITRFEDSAYEHEAFFLKDPSNNLVEFKHYRNPEMMY